MDNCQDGSDLPAISVTKDRMTFSLRLLVSRIDIVKLVKGFFQGYVFPVVG